ncbi:FecR family protein [Nitrospirillum sp. BR 11828]|uniref:FecR family protein n=1 Tax=Nitrospirillum sp. BR 11828 TaxID=3104325 RepID=UPI002ACA49A5|nr:FecR domain-containing protein [Nitrospirillum sp. BR 11828]MDZ5649188.1 FecR domain-containing protein [Nitrospirillum sp. BR 11828]
MTVGSPPLSPGGAPPSEAMLEAAADWVLADEPWTPARQAAFLAWLAADPAHARATEQVRALWEDPALAQALAEGVPAAANDDVPRPFLASRRRALAAGVAGVAALAGAGAWLRQVAWDRAAPDRNDEYATAIGQRREVALADGGALVLDAASRVTVAGRRLDLLAGQVAVRVAPAGQPWRAQARSLAVEVADGAFILDRSAGQVDLTVTAGRAAARVDDRHHDLTVGDRLVVAAGGGVVRDRVDPGDADAFRQGWLVVRDQRLDVVVAHLARYSPRSLALARPDLGKLPISGRFRLDQPADSLRLIAGLYGLRLGESGDGLRLG